MEKIEPVEKAINTTNLIYQIPWYIAIPTIVIVVIIAVVVVKRLKKK